MGNKHHYSIQYRYDSLNRLIMTTIDNRERYQYGYDPTGSLTRAQFSKMSPDTSQDSAGFSVGAEEQNGDPMAWFMLRDDIQYGPYSWEELVNFAESERLVRGDLLWQEGMGDWTPAEKIKGLFN